jgi:hypothetical protein
VFGWQVGARTFCFLLSRLFLLAWACGVRNFLKTFILLHLKSCFARIFITFLSRNIHVAQSFLCTIDMVRRVEDAFFYFLCFFNKESFILKGYQERYITRIYNFGDVSLLVIFNIKLPLSKKHKKTKNASSTRRTISIVQRKLWTNADISR